MRKPYIPRTADTSKPRQAIAVNAKRRREATHPRRTLPKAIDMATTLVLVPRPSPSVLRGEGTNRGQRRRAASVSSPSSPECGRASHSRGRQEDLPVRSSQPAGDVRRELGATSRIEGERR